MKRVSAIISALLFTAVVLSACNSSNNIDADIITETEIFTSNTTQAPSSSTVQPLTVTELPDNIYTQQITEPEAGKINFIIDNSRNGYYTVNWKNINQQQSMEYIERLKELGYKEVSITSNETLISATLTKDNVILNIAYTDNTVGIVIKI